MKHLINGMLVDGNADLIAVNSPTDGSLVGEFNGVDVAQTEECLHAAQAAFEKWSALSLNEREEYILKFADVVESHENEIIDLLIKETGKTYGNAYEDYKMLPDCLRYFIGEAKSMCGSMIPDYTEKHLNMIIRKPLGVVVGYLAWNFPLLNVGYKVGPALASGCTCIIKPSSQTPLTTMYIGELAVEAGLPAGVLNVISGSNETVGSTLNKSDIPQLITLIGSSQSGKKIIEQSATSIKHYSLELGGNAPAIVMKDADVDKAVNCIAGGKTNNAGQICVAPNRVFVHESVMPEFLEKIKIFLSDFEYGSGKANGKKLMQPVISNRAVQAMESLVKDAVDKGATVVTGGKRHGEVGCFFEPTVLTGVTKDMRVYKEEIFGPIIPILSFNDESDLPKLANDTEYGLAAYIYTSSLDAGVSLSRKIDAGTVCVNEPFFSYNLPHGGCKQSGVGKDCSTYSLEEYYYIQRITVALNN